MRVMPSVASGRYSPGPGTETLLEERIDQEIRQAVANCSPDGQVSSLQSRDLDTFVESVRRKILVIDARPGSMRPARCRAERAGFPRKSEATEVWRHAERVALLWLRYAPELL